MPSAPLCHDAFENGPIRKVTLVVGLVIALSMLEVNIGPFLAAIGATGFILWGSLCGPHRSLLAHLSQLPTY